MTIRNCVTCQTSIIHQCEGCTGPNWQGKEVEQPQDPLRAEIDRLKALLDEAYADADDVLRPRIAELEHKISNLENRLLEMSESINALKDKWYRRGIAGFQEAIKAEREECAKACEELDSYNDDDPGESFARAIRTRSIQFDESRADAIGQNGNDGLAYPDPHVESVRARLSERAAAGLLKYGTDTTRTDLTRAQWLRHAQEEALDLAVYLERLISDDEQAESKQ